jgi:hypothetical protein
MELKYQRMDNPFACKLESALSLFGHQTRLEEVNSMSTTLITDYFPIR